MTPRDPEPQVSVIIPAHNAEATLGLQLLALAAQDSAPVFEVLVVDNRSTDGTASLASRCGEDIALDLRVITADQHQGASYARNVGAAHARAPRLMFCDADDVVSTHWVHHGLLSFASTDLWSGSALVVGDDVYDTNDLEVIRAAIPTGYPFREPLVKQHTVFPILMGGNFGCTAEIFGQLQGFDQSFASNGEDNDFAFRAQQVGHHIYDAESVTLAYRGRWQPSVRRRLARRSARSHAMLATRYGARNQSSYPRTVVEAAKILAFPVAAVAGRRQWDSEEFGYRIARWIGFVEGRLRYGLLKRDTGPRLGVGLEG
ncbi:glycosyltransferase family 2 protein [Kocuria sp.]|uniref:glycosyltransferase family 2 protein n=1 Tax=Kocuria sp. TaxID=1871328 RepID=UPI0026DF5C21|nr:glycosyltransferase family 2 protein [Kocuria sp.]MDO5618396.1 glycosyltransferase [Kocuria sp.]